MFEYRGARPSLRVLAPVLMPSTNVCVGGNPNAIGTTHEGGIRNPCWCLLALSQLFIGVRAAVVAVVVVVVVVVVVGGVAVVVVVVVCAFWGLRGFYCSLLFLCCGACFLVGCVL
jgi:hypothetical protein